MSTRVVPVLVQCVDEAMLRAYLDERHSLNAQPILSGIDAGGQAFTVWLEETNGVTLPKMVAPQRSVTEHATVSLKCRVGRECQGLLAFPVHLAVQVEVGA